MWFRKLSAFTVLCFGLVPTALAEDRIDKALAAIPDDALAFVCVPSLQSVDRDAQRIIEELGLKPMVPLPNGSLMEFIKQKLPNLEGLDEDGPLILIMFPGDSEEELQPKQALMVSAENPKDLLQAMGAEQGEGGVWSAEMFGQPAYAAIREEFVILAPEAKIVKQVKDAAMSLSKKLSKPVRSATSDLDAFMWINMKQLFSLIQPMIEEKFYPILDAQTGGDPWDQKSTELTKKQMDLFFDGAEQMTFGVGLDPSGVSLRFLVTLQPGSEMDKMTEVSVTSEPLLLGLGEPSYVLATGQTADEKQMQVQFNNHEMYFELFEDVEGIDQDKLKQLKDDLEAWFLLARGGRAAVVPLDTDSGGLIGLTIVADTADSKKWLNLTGDVTKVLRELVSETDTDLDEDLERMLDALVYEGAEEQIGDTSVSHLRLDLEKLEELDEDTIDQLSAVIGEEGVFVRVAAVDSKSVLIAMGGGIDRFEELLKQARSGDTALSEHAGIRQVADHLPQERNSAFYLDVDQGFALAQQVLDALDEDQLPFNVPEIATPVAMTATGGSTWSQFDIFVPMEVVTAAKNITLTMMGAAGD